MDELTPEQINLLRTLKENEARLLLQKMLKELIEETESQIKLQARNYSAVKAHSYTIYEILGAFIEGVEKPAQIIDELTTAEEKEKAIEEVNKSEEIAG